MSGMRMVVAMMLALLWSMPMGVADAQTGRPDAAEVKALAIKAADFVATHGIAAAEAAFLAQGEFRYGEVYVNVIDLAGVWVIYPPSPHRKGKSILSFVDEDGKHLGEEILAIGQRGEGWAEYRWRNPATNAIQPKRSYVRKVPGLDYVVYVGVYQ